MLTVYKYPVPIDDYFTLLMPRGAKILTVQLQAGVMQLCALVDPSAPSRDRRFRFAGTGHPIEDSADQLAYVATVQLAGGGLVFHVFEVLSKGGDS